MFEFGYVVEELFDLIFRCEFYDLFYIRLVVLGLVEKDYFVGCR